MDEIDKVKLKLKMMEISFEQINNSRNDLLRQLGECEFTLTKVNEWINKHLEMFPESVLGKELKEIIKCK